MENLNIVQMVLQYVDIIYILLCNIITYFTISIIEYYSKKEQPKFKLKKSLKRIISAIVGVLLAFVVVGSFKHNTEVVFYSFFIQFLTWDYFFKWIKNKLKSKT